MQFGAVLFHTNSLSKIVVLPAAYHFLEQYELSNRRRTADGVEEICGYLQRSTATPAQPEISVFQGVLNWTRGEPSSTRKRG